MKGGSGKGGSLRRDSASIIIQGQCAENGRRNPFKEYLSSSRDKKKTFEFLRGGETF